MKKLISLVVVLTVLLAACGSSKYNDGTYTGVGQGHGGDVTVSVVISKDKITTIEVVSHNETPGISSAPIEQLPGKVVDKQSTDIDVIAGATLTSEAILEAINQAIVKAKK